MLEKPFLPSTEPVYLSSMGLTPLILAAAVSELIANLDIPGLTGMNKFITSPAAFVLVLTVYASLANKECNIFIICGDSLGPTPD